MQCEWMKPNLSISIKKVFSRQHRGQLALNIRDVAKVMWSDKEEMLGVL